MRLLKTCLFFTALTVFLSCGDGQDELDIFSMTYDFNGFNVSEGEWLADFTDYTYPDTPDELLAYNWAYYYGDSAKVSNGGNAVILSCNNVNSDIFMFLKTKVSALRPNTNYNLVFDVSVATNAQSGEGVILKVGGSDLEPKKVVVENYCTLNIDKGSTLNSGESLISLGDIGKTGVTTVFIEKNNANSLNPLVVKSNSQGELWLIVGTDSILNGQNAVYYSKINVVFSVSN